MDDNKVLASASVPASASASKPNLVPLVVFIVIFTIIIVCFSVISGDFKSPWYTNLRKPPGMIPPAGFGIVWTILYVGLIVAVIMSIYLASTSDKRNMITIIYCVTLLLTLLWVVMFSGFHETVASLIILILTLIFAGVLCWITKPDQLSNNSKGWYIIPSIIFLLFFIWLIVATYYNLGVVLLN